MRSFASYSSKVGAVVLSAALAYSRGANAEPLRLRGDALVQTRSPVGLLVLRGEDPVAPWLDVETVTWVGAIGALPGAAWSASDGVTPTGDVLTLSVRAREQKSGSEVRGGRMLVTMGAVRPLHLDGVRGLGRVFGGTTVEAFGGVPVARRFEYDDFRWAAGGRVGQAFGDVAVVGGSYAVRRRSSHRDDEEVGADMALTPVPWLTAAGRAAFDVVSRGPTDALVSVSAENRELRGEVFTTHRTPSRLLPRTSLFSVLGDFAATSSGGTLRWRAFPRLELVGTGSVQVQGGDVGGQGVARASLALDDEWAGSLGLEARRVDFHGARWTGARATVMVPLDAAFHVSTELELVVPDSPQGRGAVWPWGLGAIGWRSGTGWEVATAIEASAGGYAYRQAVYGLARVSYAFDGIARPARSIQ